MRVRVPSQDLTRLPVRQAMWGIAGVGLIALSVLLLTVAEMRAQSGRVSSSPLGDATG